MRIRFGEFELDGNRQEVLRGDEPVHLTTKAIALLTLLIESRPDVVTRQQLMDGLWPDVVVSPANLKNLVSELRNALDDHGRRGRFIRNVHGRGYAFTDQAFELDESSRAPATPAVALLHEGRRFLLRPGETLLGRSGDSAVNIDSDEVSRRHARICVTLETVTIEDLESKNGTFVNGARIEAMTTLHDGDRIALGSVRLTARMSRRDDSTRTAM